MHCFGSLCICIPSLHVFFLTFLSAYYQCILVDFLPGYYVLIVCFVGKAEQ